jgi:tRNA-specific 2-thiouridylase
MKRTGNKRKLKTPLKKKVFVGMSGGVDSSVTAALLKEQGLDVTGVHIKMWSDPSIPCNFKEDRYDALRAAEKIGIPFQTWDLTEEYRTAVVEYMIAEYAAGRTPNPDVMCNRHVKFGVFLRTALERGGDAIATGHYVRLADGHLYEAVDKNKDQSYFLWTLTQEQLRHALFPIGGYTKSEVRQMARERGLPTAEKKDSQGICFIGEIDLNAFLKKHIPVSRGPVVTTAGKNVGEHEGLAFYTIGQRHGIHIGGGIPYYVAGKIPANNTLVIAEGPYDAQLFADEMRVSGVNWIGGTPPPLPLSCHARIRYRQPLQKCVIEEAADDATLRVRFAEPQRAVTPGQSAVFYRGEEVLGGGVIE